ncbi:T9SS type A sorting domain-containing protein [Rubrivirga sp.]|uniref:T9SS type A sorting domain-containing protein n=1 Tax=Rubrivirga sp. TaxID=1885344 RepID=UPI003B51DD23
MDRSGLRFRLLAAALVLSAVAGPASSQTPPDVTWEFVGADSAGVDALALVDPADGQPFGLPHPAFATFYFPAPYHYPNGEYPHPYSFGLVRLAEGGKNRTASPDSSWDLLAEYRGPNGLYADASGLVVTTEFGSRPLQRSTDGGATWADVDTDECNGDGIDARIVRTYGPGRERALWVVGQLCRSDDDGATWTPVPQLAAPEYVRRRDLLELPPSAALPEGRLVLGVGAGVLLSDDNGSTWVGSSLNQYFRWVGNDLVLVPDPAHPYGGTAYVSAKDFHFEDRGYIVVLASDDGGATWDERHRFVFGEHGLARIDGNPELVALGDGSLVTGLLQTVGGSAQDLGTVVWSGDGGQTWHPLGPQPPWLGERPPAGACDPACEGGAWPGWGAKHLRVDRAGRVWAGTDNGVWRTTGPAWAVASETDVPDVPGLGLSVRPNPAGRAATVSASLAHSASVRVSVHDVLGREVAVLHDGPASGDAEWSVDTGGWVPGTYVVRVTAGAARATATLTVAR